MEDTEGIDANHTRFCVECGQENKLLPSGRFHPDTGKPQKFRQCVNPKCQLGCATLGGHLFRFSFWDRFRGREQCCRCGFIGLIEDNGNW